MFSCLPNRSLRVAILAAWTFLLLGHAGAASAQFKLQETFRNATSAWTLTDSAILTAPSIDPIGSGWLRMTAALNNEKGLALDTAFGFAANQPVVVEFNYVSWGGTGADGMTLFLYDSTTPSPMTGAYVGGGLGYCGGAGGYLAIGLDEFGNFSNPADKCLAASGGPGFKPESFVIRGPLSANNAWVTTAAVTGGIDNPHVSTRPSAKTVLLSLTPAVPPAVGYTITAQFQPAAGQPFLTLFSNVPFPYAAPANMSVGFSGSTGGSTNVHELQGLIAATPNDLQVTTTGPTTVLQGAQATYTVTVANNGNYAIGSADAPTIADTLSAALTGVNWTCVGAGGATCDASGTGNLSTANVTLPANGSVTYTLTGTVSATATCGSTATSSASADFGSTSTFLDPNETNNTASVVSTVTCNATLVATPTPLSFAPQTINTNSTAQPVTVTEGLNSSTIDSITVSGDYTQTNNCPAALPASQTCTINVVFTPTAEGSRNGALTILSHAAASPQVTSVVTLSGTGTNAVPSAFSFTPLNNVDLSSLQVSNIITVANTNVPSPISISNGGQYSINGGAFTTVPGVVSPGAQVQVEVNAASNYSTAATVTLTIGGVAADFTVTTGTQPAAQGAYTPVTGVAPSSIQVSNALTIAGTGSPTAITVSAGAQYSINGGAFTANPGTVQSGDQVRLQVTAPATYNTTASAAITVGGVNSSWSVTTGTQPAAQGAYTPVTGVAPSSIQVSNALTITGIGSPTAISVSTGAQYSINGGAFTANPGTVQSGDQVRLQVTAPATYNTTASAAITVGGVDSSWSVTTAAQPVIQGGFTPVTTTNLSSSQVSNPITVTGTTVPVFITISSGAQYSINGGPFTSATGLVSPGDQVRVQVTGPTAYNSSVTATLNIGGVEIKFTVSTGQQPQLQNVVVTAGGGGAVDVLLLMVLSCAAALRICGWRRLLSPLRVLPVLLVSVLACTNARADGLLSNIYAGARLGGSTSSMTASELTSGLAAKGYSVTAANGQSATRSATLYVGYELTHDFSAELGFSYLGRTRAVLEGPVPPNLDQLLADAAHIVRGAGDIVSLEGRYRWQLKPRIAVDLRAGPYLWITKTDVTVAGAEALSRTDKGPGFTFGVGPRFALFRHVGLGLSADYFGSTASNHFLQFTGTIEYHF